MGQKGSNLKANSNAGSQQVDINFQSQAQSRPQTAPQNSDINQSSKKPNPFQASISKQKSEIKYAPQMGDSMQPEESQLKKSNGRKNGRGNKGNKDASRPETANPQSQINQNNSSAIKQSEPNSSTKKNASIPETANRQSKINQNNSSAIKQSQPNSAIMKNAQDSSPIQGLLATALKINTNKAPVDIKSQAPTSNISRSSNQQSVKKLPNMNQPVNQPNMNQPNMNQPNMNSPLKLIESQSSPQIQNKVAASVIIPAPVSEGKKLYDAGKYPEAYKVLKTELQGLVKSGSSAITVATTYNLIGLASWKLKKFEEAIDNYKISLATWKNADNKSNEATLLSNIAFVYSEQQNHEEAAKYFEESYLVYQKIGSKEDKNRSKAAQNAGLSFSKCGKYSKSYSYLKISTELDKSVLGNNHADMAHHYNELGLSCVTLGKHQEGLDTLKQAFEILKDAKSPLFSDTLLNMGLAFKGLKRYQEAVDYTLQALELRITKNGENHSDVATCYNNLGVIMQEQEKCDEALIYHEKALQIWSAANPESASVATSFYNTGNMLLKLKRYDEAMIYFEKSLEIRKKILGPDHPATKNVITAIETMKIGGPDSKKK